VKEWTLASIKDHADMAETYPGSGALNWGEIGWEALSAFVALSVEIAGDATLPECDVESVKGEFERWWKSTNAPAQAGAAATSLKPVVRHSGGNA
jgi:hypothetical protein